MRRWVTGALAIAAIVAATCIYLLRVSDKQPVDASSRIIRPETRVITNSVNATGTVRLRVGSEVRVGSQLSGIVKKLHVTVGSHVRAGDVIAEIDDTPTQARLADAEAQVEIDEAGVARARVNSRRADQLANQGLIPQQQKEDLALALQEAAARYKKSERDRDLVKVDLSYVRILAPISGTVASVSTQEGETVAASFTAPTFVTIIADDSLQLVAMVDETDIANVRPGNQAGFTVDSFSSRDFPGHVLSIAPKATIVSGIVNYEVTINIDRNAQLLKPDMTANVSIHTAQHQALLLPAAAVGRDGEQAFVTIPTPNGPQRKTVVVGAKEGEMIEVRRGISGKEEVLLITPSDNRQRQP